jgi:hypothetical protein
MTTVSKPNNSPPREEMMEINVRNVTLPSDFTGVSKGGQEVGVSIDVFFVNRSKFWALTAPSAINRRGGRAFRRPIMSVLLICRRDRCRAAG